MQQGPFNRFLFRLSPCVNLFYCLLLFNHPMGSIPTEDTAIFGIWPRQTKLHVRGNQGLVIGSRQPIFFYKDRIPSGVFEFTSLAVYASALNHVFGQMLGFPGSWVCRLMFCYHPVKAGQRRTTAIVPWLFRMSASVEKAEN